MQAITKIDREHLQDMLTTPGYRVLLKIMESYLEAVTEGCVALSKNDPLGHSEQVVNAWAYLAMSERFQSMVIAGVEYEIKSLTAPENQAPTPEQQRRQKIWDSTGMIGTMPENFKPPIFSRR